MEAGNDNKTQTFKAIDYEDARQINYLRDFKALAPANEAFIERVSQNEAVTNGKKQSAFDNIGDLLSRRILKTGYIDKPSKVSKKGKKGETDANYYNPTDDFINDDECCIEKKDKTSSFEDYVCADMSIEALYNSQMYKDKVSDVVEEATQKRKAPDQFDPNNEQDAQTYDEVKKKIIKFIQLNQVAATPPQNPPVPPQPEEPKPEEPAQARKDDRQEARSEGKQEEAQKQVTVEKSGTEGPQVIVID